MSEPRPGVPRLRRFDAQYDARLRLVCFPYAGGGISVFRAWPRSLPRGTEVCALELPGRDTLIGERPFTRLPDLIEEVRLALQPLTKTPFVLFGHSMGALIAFELVRALRRHRARLPEALCVSGHRAPQLPDPRKPLHGLPDGDFLTELQRLQGTPPQVLEHRELMDLFLPLLRADFTLSETYEYVPETPLPVPLLAWGGRDDAEVSPSEIAAWKTQTSSGFRLRMLPGSHFFVHSAAALLLESLGEELERLVEEVPAIPVWRGAPRPR